MRHVYDAILSGERGYLGLRPGATKAELSTYENRLGITLPTTVRSVAQREGSLLRAEWTGDGVTHEIGFDIYGDWLPNAGGRRFLSIGKNNDRPCFAFDVDAPDWPVCIVSDADARRIAPNLTAFLEEATRRGGPSAVRWHAGPTTVEPPTMSAAPPARDVEPPWRRWVWIWLDLVARIHAFGGNAYCGVHPPATIAQVEAAEAALGHPLPPEFRHTLLAFSRDFTILWECGELESEPTDDTPLPGGIVPKDLRKDAEAAGYLSWGLGHIVDAANVFLPFLRHPYAPERSYYAIHLENGGVYYQSKSGWCRLARDFSSFVSLATELGVPSPALQYATHFVDGYRPFFDDPRDDTEVSLDHPNAKRWRALLQMPEL